MAERPPVAASGPFEEGKRHVRFILKCAFWLGLLAFVMPFGGRGETAANISWFGALAGAQQALQDIGGFCDRAPDACSTGREVAVFTGERIGDGLALAYDYVEKRREPAETAADDTGAAPSRSAAATDPIATGAVEPPLPRAYTAPKRPAAVGAEARTASVPARIAVPTPAPRA